MIGDFSLPRSSQSIARGLECNAAGRLSAPNRAIIPILSRVGKSSLSLSWRPDPGFRGAVRAKVFAATDGMTFWTWESEPVELTWSPEQTAAAGASNTIVTLVPVLLASYLSLRFL